MHREEIVQKIRENRETLRGMGVRTITLFGSAARNELQPHSDIDLLVDFENPPGFIGVYASQVLSAGPFRKRGRPRYARRVKAMGTRDC